jgi:hypothetical protein
VRKIFFAVICTAFSVVSFPQSIPFVGARANGLAYASSCLDDEWAIFNNPAGAAKAKNHIAASCIDIVPGFPAWNRYAGVFNMPLAKGGLSLGVLKSGDQLFSQQMLSIGYANKFGITSLGISAQLIQYDAEGFGTRSVPSFSIGGITELYPWLTVGACIVNLIQPEVTEGEKIPAVLIAGAGFKVSEKVSAFTEVEKHISAGPLVKAAAEYRFSNNFVLRTGFHPDPSAGFFGFGFRRNRLLLDYAFTYIPSIGTRHQTGVAYKIKEAE